MNYSQLQGRNLSDNWGGGGVYSYIRVMPDGFLLKSTQIQITLISSWIVKKRSLTIHDMIFTISSTL